MSWKTCFIYIAQARRLKKQARGISNWSEILSQINQKILKASKNNRNSWKAL